MDKLLRSLSKTTIAFLAIGASIVFIIYLNPPHTVCDTQEEVFRNSQAGGIFPAKSGVMGRSPRLFSEVDKCKIANSPGGCADTFALLERLLVDFKHVPRECYAKISQIPEVRTVVFGAMTLMANLAWGDKPPGEGLNRFGFFSASDLYIFCNLKQFALDFYGEAYFANYRQSTFAQHPGAANLDNTEIWNRSIFSTQCNAYL